MRNRAAALAILPVGVIALAFVPGFSEWAVVFWLVGLSVMLAAVVYASLASHRPR